MLRTKVVRAKAARPSGPGSAMVTAGVAALAAPVSPWSGSLAAPASITPPFEGLYAHRGKAPPGRFTSASTRAPWVANRMSGARAPGAASQFLGQLGARALDRLGGNAVVLGRRLADAAPLGIGGGVLGHGRRPSAGDTRVDHSRGRERHAGRRASRPGTLAAQADA